MATDGRRLALVDLEVEFPSSQETEIIVSTKAVTEIQRLLRKEGEVKLSIGENQIAFELNRALLVSKLIEGNYPNCRQCAVISKRHGLTDTAKVRLNKDLIAFLESDESKPQTPAHG